MGKRIIWSPTAKSQLKDIHANILELSKSIRTSDSVINDILKSTAILSSNSEIYTLDKNKFNNDGSYRSFEIRHYNIAYRILDDSIRIIRIRYAGKEPKQY